MRIEILLAILPAVLAAETVAADGTAASASGSSQSGISCNLQCSMVVEAQAKYCPNDSTGACLCSLSIDTFWNYYAECNCTNPDGVAADAILSQACATVQGASQAGSAGATSSLEAGSVAPVDVSIGESTTTGEAVAEAALSSLAIVGQCNLHCQEADSIQQQVCSDGDLNCLCLLSTEQYWQHVHDCDCINDKNLSVEEIKSRVCNATSDVLSSAASAAGGEVISTVSTVPQISAYGGDSSSTGAVPQVSLQNENLSSKKAIFSIGALAVIMVSFL